MIKKYSLQSIYFILIFLLGILLSGCNYRISENSPQISNVENSKIIKNDLFEKLNLENNCDISFNGIIDNKLLFNIYTQDGTDIYKTIGLYYMDINDGKIYTIKEISDGRIWDFKYENGLLIYTKIQIDKTNPEGPYIIDVIKEENSNVYLIDTGYIYSPQKTPSLQKIDGDYYYLLESLIISDSQNNSSVNKYSTTFNKINNSTKEVIFENTSNIENYTIHSNQWLLSSTEFSAYNNIGVFIATKNNNTILYLFKDNKLTKKNFEDIITNAYVLGDNILLEIRTSLESEDIAFEYKLYNPSNNSLKSISINKEIFRIANLDNNRLICLDEENNTNILSYINGKFEIKILDSLSQKLSFFYPINDKSILVYQYEYNSNQSKNYLYNIELE